MKIAVIGTGIAGNVAAYHLAKDHEITVFEAADYVGGHTNTVDVEHGGRRYAVDTGFIVFNDWTYPEFIHLMDELGVASQPSSMSFSVSCDKTGLEYNGTSRNALFAQRSNLLRPSFYRMIADILRFNREAPALLDDPDNGVTLGQYLADGGYTRRFIEHYIVPMGAAIWSAKPDGLIHMPAAFFVRFFHNHGMLNIRNRPTWRVIRGGSREYLQPLIAGHRDRIRLRCPVQWIRRDAGGVQIKARDCEPERFDQVFLACHSDQALALLADASPLEREVLGAIPYQKNEAVLHTDETLMPKRRLAWAAWNYHLLSRQQERVALTYNMNILQSLDAPCQFCVTLNNSEAIDPSTVIERFDYDHPILNSEAVAAQQRHGEVNGVNRTYFCGAYWRFGFHEDGVVSALAALGHFNERNQDQQLHLRRAG
ncbi:MAG: FAD-dependent oxidoreductase [Gammaproteobacteria bacterium]|jgi:predicted NAD/FAD-binding protein